MYSIISIIKIVTIYIKDDYLEKTSRQLKVLDDWLIYKHHFNYFQAYDCADISVPQVNWPIGMPNFVFTELVSARLQVWRVCKFCAFDALRSKKWTFSDF